MTGTLTSDSMSNRNQKESRECDWTEKRPLVHASQHEDQLDFDGHQCILIEGLLKPWNPASQEQGMQGNNQILANYGNL